MKSNNICQYALPHPYRACHHYYLTSCKIRDLQPQLIVSNLVIGREGGACLLFLFVCAFLTWLGYYYKLYHQLHSRALIITNHQLRSCVIVLMYHQLGGAVFFSSCTINWVAVFSLPYTINWVEKVSFSDDRDTEGVNVQKLCVKCIKYCHLLSLCIPTAYLLIC